MGDDMEPHGFAEHRTKRKKLEDLIPRCFLCFRLYGQRSTST
jgi:hypothetical protein